MLNGARFCHSFDCRKNVVLIVINRGKCERKVNKEGESEAFNFRRAKGRIMRSKNALKSFVASRLFQSPIARDTLLKLLHWPQILKPKFCVCLQSFPGTIGQCDGACGFAEVEVALGERNLPNGQTRADRFHDE